MALLDILELGELLLSWRLYIGIAITCAICVLVFQIVSDDTIGWFICVPIGIIGLILGFRWQVRAGDKL